MTESTGHRHPDAQSGPLPARGPLDELVESLAPIRRRLEVEVLVPMLKVLDSIARRIGF